MPSADILITGGNVSLYNETDGSGVLPTPLSRRADRGRHPRVGPARSVRRRRHRPVGETLNELGGSDPACRTTRFAVPPQLDLAREAAFAGSSSAASGAIRSAHDCVEVVWPKRLRNAASTPWALRWISQESRGVSGLSRNGGAVLGVGLAGRGFGCACAAGCASRLGVGPGPACRADRSLVGISSDLGGWEAGCQRAGEQAERIWATAIESWFEKRLAIA
jgi:hypothetical protein